jgi:hypothetical protein
MSMLCCEQENAAFSATTNYPPVDDDNKHKAALKFHRAAAATYHPGALFELATMILQGKQDSN